MVQKLIEKKFVLVNFHMQCIVTKQMWNRWTISSLMSVKLGVWRWVMSLLPSQYRHTWWHF